MSQNRPLAFVVIALVLMGGALIYHLRADGVYACDGSSYGDNRYLAYCNSVSYMNYDQGSFWYKLEPGAYSAAQRADVLFVGNSKVQFALSTDETLRWFQDRYLTHYVFGFAHNETVAFFEPVLESMQPQARVYVIHVDRMFEDRLTPPMSIIKKDPGARRIFRTKKAWQVVHGLVCNYLPGACGEKFGLLRQFDNGHWLFTGSEGRLAESVDVGIGVPVDQDRWAARAMRAEEFISRLPVAKDCVLLTLIPSQQTRREEALAIADHLGIPLIAPEVANLKSFDRNHLDEASAARWSVAFYSAAGSRIDRCVNGREMNSTSEEGATR